MNTIVHHTSLRESGGSPAPSPTDALAIQVVELRTRVMELAVLVGRLQRLEDLLDRQSRLYGEGYRS
jgi:hypothetical protein